MGSQQSFDSNLMGILKKARELNYQSVGRLCHPWNHVVVSLQLDPFCRHRIRAESKTHFREEAWVLVNGRFQ